MQSLAILLGCIAAAVIYGIAHDQITARICVEYFTVGHPPVFPTESPTLLGLGWGIIATWWVGALLGIPLAIAARAGRRPKRDTASSRGWRAMPWPAGAIHLAPWLAAHIPEEKHARFLADGFAHSASYSIGFLGVMVVIARTWRSRRQIPAG